jgi:hypothetical protein
LFKFGMIKSELTDTWSTDVDIEKLLRSKKSFAEFTPPAIEIMRWRVSTAAALDEKLDVSTAEATSAVPTDSVGLVFVGVSDGHLFVEELDVIPPWIETQVGGSTKYHFTVPALAWQRVTDQLGLHLYPKSITLPQTIGQRFAQQPEHLDSFLKEMENQTPCKVGPPNSFLKVTAQQVRANSGPPLHSAKRWKDVAVVDWRDHGACPSWSELSIPRPSSCTDSQLRRE